MKVLFVFHGMVKNAGKVSVSGGDVRLLEIIKRTPKVEPYLLTTPNGREFMSKYDVKYRQAYVFKRVMSGGLIDNLMMSINSWFYGSTGVKKYKDGAVYSSCEHLYDVLPALRLKLFNKCKWYAVYHWVEDYPWREKRGNTPPVPRYAYWLNRWFSGFLIKHFADQILAVSDQTKEKLVRMKRIPTPKLKAVYCGVDYAAIDKVAKKHASEKAKTYDAVFMKRLNYGKGVLDLLKIWNEVCKQKKDARLAIIGDGSEEVLAKVRAFIKKHKLEKNIHILGVIYDFTEKFRILNSAKIFLLPTHEENWAIVIGEAMACDLPVVVSRLKEIEPIWKDNVVWSEVGDIQGFADNVLQLLGSEKNRTALAKKAKRFVKQYDWQTIAEQEFN